MIKIHLSKMLGEKRWTQAYLSQVTKVRPNTIFDIYNEFCISININHLDAICKALKCDIADLIEFIPPSNNGEKTATR